MSRPNTQWLRDAGWGVMCHYLAGLPGGGEDAYAVTAEEWKIVNAIARRKPPSS